MQNLRGLGGSECLCRLPWLKASLVHPDSFYCATTCPLIRNWDKITINGLPWWRSGWESACQCRGRGFAPWSGKIPHAAERLGPWATITEPARLEPVLWNKRGRDNERPAHRDEERPPLATTRESPRTETKTQHSNQSINQSINKNLKKKKITISIGRLSKSVSKAHISETD